MNASNPTPRSAPGSHNPDFSPENPAISWAKENKGYLTFLILALTLGSAFNYYWPRHQQQSLSTSWGLFQELTADPANFSGEKVGETLARAREDARTFPWVVHTGVTAAIQAKDDQALGILKGELEALAQDPDLAGYRLVGDNGPESVFAYSLALVQQAMSPDAERSFTNPEPTGARVKFVLTANGSDTYEFEAALYPEAAPQACERFLAALGAGRMAGAPGLRQGSFGFKFTGKADESADEVEPLMVERSFGYFHLPGALTLVQTPGEVGQMAEDTFELTIAAAPHLDGQTTVFGMITSGLEQLEALQYAGPDTPDAIDGMILTSIEVVE
jgi:cyclophilin family peptidyl-prolyl cis-trans isomerase